MSQDARIKTGRFPAYDAKDFPLLGKPFGKKFFFKDEISGEIKEIPYGIIDGVYGGGGFATIYRIRFDMNHAWRREYGLGEHGAVKILGSRSNPEAANNPELIKRFKREGKIGIALRGEDMPRSLLKVLEYCEVKYEDRTYHCILMESIEHGEDLSRYVLPDPNKGEKLVNRLSLEECLLIGRELVNALDYAHRRGIFHRDLKPSNLLRSRKSKDEVKLIDFGLGAYRELEAELASSSVDEMTVDELTQDKDFRGTVHYASPEAAMGKIKEFPKEIDVWGAGATMYSFLAGAPPYPGSVETQAERIGLLTKIARYDEEKYNRAEDIPFLKEVTPEVPGSINDWVMRCLEKDRKRRMRSENMKINYEDALREIGFKVS